MGIIDVCNKQIICVDNSTNSFAYAIGKGGELIEYGEIKYPGNSTYDRLVHINSCLAPIKEKCKDVRNLYIEQTTFIQSKQTVILMGVAEGAAISSIAHPGMVISRPSPIVWQRAIGNPPLTRDEKAEIQKTNPTKKAAWQKAEWRRVRKKRTIDIINAHYGLDITSDNVGDAIGIFMWATNRA